MIGRSRMVLAGLGCCATLLLGGALTQGTAAAAGATPAALAGPARSAGAGPNGFWWGTDSLPVTVSGKAPYAMPYLGGAYGGYIGMTGNWAYWLGCSGQAHFIAYSATNAAQAHTNFTQYGK